MAKKKKQEFSCTKCKLRWIVTDSQGIVKCEMCGGVATQIIRAPTKWKRTPRGGDSMHGGDNFDPSPIYENATRFYEDG